MVLDVCKNIVIMEKAPNQILHFGEITKDGEVRELTAEEFAEKYLKGGKKKKERISNAV